MKKTLERLTWALAGICFALLFTVAAIGPARLAAAAVNMSTVAASGNYLATPGTPGFMPGADKTKLDGIQAGADDLSDSTKVATTTAQGAMAALDKEAAPIEVDLAIGCVLPAYTKTGSAGSEVLTANANGALSAFCTNGITVSGGATKRVLFYYNDTSTPDAGVFVLTQGTGGTPWALTRSTTNGENTAARLQGSTVIVRDGFEKGVFVSRNPTISAIGTDALLWVGVGWPGDRHGFAAVATFSEGQAVIAGANVSSQYRGWRSTAGGTASAITASQTGSADFTTGSVNNGTARLMTQTYTNATRLDATFGVRWSVPTVSDGTNTFSIALGAELDANNFSRILLTPTAGAAINHLTTVASVADTTRQLCASCFAAGTTYWYELRKPFGATQFQIWFDSGTGTLAYVADTPSLPSTFYFTTVITKSVGTTARTLTEYDAYATVIDPKVMAL